MNKYESFGNRLESLMKKYNILQKDLGNVIGVSRSYISHFCNGLYLPNREQFNQIMKYFDNHGMDDDDFNNLNILYGQHMLGSDAMKTIMSAAIASRPPAPTIEQVRRATGVPSASKSGMEKYYKMKIAVLNIEQLRTLCIYLFERVKEEQLSDAMLCLDDLARIKPLTVHEESTEYKSDNTAKKVKIDR